MDVHTIGAFRGCAEPGHGGVAYRAVLERTGPAAVAALLAAATRAGVRCPLGPGGSSSVHAHCYAVLDVLDREGDILDDCCIPTVQAWEWWRQAAELRPSLSDCPDVTVGPTR